MLRNVSFAVITFYVLFLGLQYWQFEDMQKVKPRCQTLLRVELSADDIVTDYVTEGFRHCSYFVKLHLTNETYFTACDDQPRDSEARKGRSHMNWPWPIPNFAIWCEDNDHRLFIFLPATHEVFISY